MCVKFEPSQKARPVSEYQRLGEQLFVVTQQKRSLCLAEQHLRTQWLRGRRNSCTIGSRLGLRSVTAAVGACGRRRSGRQRVAEWAQRLRRYALLEQRMYLLRACGIGECERCFQSRGDYTNCYRKKLRTFAMLFKK